MKKTKKLSSVWYLVMHRGDNLWVVETVKYWDHFQDMPRVFLAGATRPQVVPVYDLFEDEALALTEATVRNEADNA